MARPKSLTVTDLELEIMQFLWTRSDATSQEVTEALAGKGRVLAPSSIRTMLGILLKKGYVERRPMKRGFAYHPIVSREQTEKHVVQTLVRRMFRGSAMELVSALLRGDMVSRKDISRAQRMIREKEKGGRK